MSHPKVAVRIRPLSEREKQTNAISVVSVENENTISITNIKVPEQNAGDSRERVRRFTFDHCFNENSTQDEVFEAVEDVVQKAVKMRYHSCVLAYGQSSSGKTHTMMGFANDAGLTPRLCRNVFAYFQAGASEEEIKNFNTTVSYLEIYNEKVRDLLVTKSDSRENPGYASLKVREHPRKGPYVQGLSEHTVEDSKSLLEWLQRGNNNRKVAATLNNPQSSRSHSVFTVTSCGGTKLHLVDLAGSERAASRCSGTSREGANINKSLVALGNVILVLAEKSSRPRNGRKRFVPYRDSLLTWLLKDTLGGNSKTIMIATVSPSNTCYSETINTLRFGQRAKQIITQPFVNEDPKEKTIRELRAEISRLKELLYLNLNQNVALVSPTALDLSNGANILEADFKLRGKYKAEEKFMEEALNVDTQKETRESESIPISSKEEEVAETQSLQNHNNKTEEIVPVMEVNSTVKEDRSSLRRTFSASEPKMERKSSKTFGSHEGIASAGNKSDKIRRSLPLSRRASVDKTTKDPSLQKKPAGAPRKIEKGVATEAKTPKVEITKRPVKQRSEIVAAVTQRLYNKVKKKEVATETEEIKPEPEVPKELTICSNARLRLQEITRRALRAHRRRDCETQTDLHPVVRVKEVSTDADDLKLVLLEVKDAQTEPSTETKDVGISCSIPHQGKAFVITRSCGTQAREDEKETSPMSFTKYLHQNQTQPKYHILSSGNPIYTSSVNINVSHNYADSTKPTANHCSDSLEDGNQQNVCFPTPDLISNHNSLDAHVNGEDLKSPEDRVTIDERVNFAETSLLGDQYVTHQRMESPLPSKICVANCTFVPKCSESLRAVDIPSVCAPEVCVVNSLAEDRCTPFRYVQPKFERPNVIETTVEKKAEPVKLQEATVLKSIRKQDTPPDSENELSDSLNYHNKKVRFSKTNSESCRMFKAMSNFLEEATSLIMNLSSIATKMDKAKSDDAQSYDVEVTINDVSPASEKSEDRSMGTQTERKTQRHSWTQTSPKRTTNASVDETEIPVNRYEALVEDSCNRLERCINRAMNGEEQPACSHETINQEFLQPFCVGNAWTPRISPYRAEDSSIESTPTFSDYGSLPRNSRRSYVRTAGCSPSAFLRHLTAMRQDIVRSSREELCTPLDGTL